MAGFPLTSDLAVSGNLAKPNVIITTYILMYTLLFQTFPLLSEEDKLIETGRISKL